jgi:hypothetical protein
MNTARTLVCEILLLFRGIIRAICKFVLGLSIVGGIVIYNLEDFTGKDLIIFIFLGGLSLAVLLGYDALLRLICPDDKDLFLPY